MATKHAAEDGVVKRCMVPAIIVGEGHDNDSDDGKQQSQNWFNRMSHKRDLIGNASCSHQIQHVIGCLQVVAGGPDS